MRTIETAIEVDAPPAAVWAVLTDFEAYAEWNPFVTEAEGRAAVGERLRVRIEPPGSRGATLRPRVTAAEPERRLEWLGRLALPRLFDGRHTFEIEPRDGGSRLVQRETLAGLLVPLLLDERAVRAGFEAMNEALAARTEARTGAEAVEPGTG